MWWRRAGDGFFSFASSSNAPVVEPANGRAGYFHSACWGKRAVLQGPREDESTLPAPCSLLPALPVPACSTLTEIQQKVRR